MDPIIPKIEKPSKNKIIEHVASLKDVKSFVYKRCAQNPEFSDDCYQDLFIALLKLDEAELIGIYQREELHFKIIGIVKGMLEGNRSTFHNTYIKPKNLKVTEKMELGGDDTRHNDTPYIDTPISYIIDKPYIKDEVDAGSEILDEAIEELKKQSEYGLYDSNIVRQWLTLGTQKEINKVFGFNKTYISNAMKRSVLNLKETMEKKIQLPEEILPSFDEKMPYSNRVESKQKIEMDEKLYASPIYVKKKGRKKVAKVVDVDKFKMKNKRKWKS